MCLAAELPQIDPIGGGLSIAPPGLPQFSGGLDLCCKRVPYSTPALPGIFPPGIFNVGAAVALGGVIDTIQDYLDGLMPDCPLE